MNQIKKLFTQKINHQLITLRITLNNFILIDISKPTTPFYIWKSIIVIMIGVSESKVNTKIYQTQYIVLYK